MAIRISTLGSGSKGNSVLIDGNGHKLLIDCGFGIRELSARLMAAGATLAELEGILVTHEHIDHIKAIKRAGEKHDIPVYMHERTCRAMGNGAPDNAYIFSTLNGFKLAGFEIHPFPVPHDAVYPLGYSISDGDSRFVYATDLGYVTDEVLAAARGADIVMLESNYDKEMLIKGPYPYYLKQRILSDYGHLCNTDCAEAVCKMLCWGTKKFILGHISQENNLAEIVYRTTCGRLAREGCIAHRDFELTIARQDALSETLLCSATN
jgi:phosphoribosyl 1,2-cyclic phosphodiesterase